MSNPNPISIFWFRRDLRLDDNAGFYRALKAEHPVLCLFIFDKNILDKLEDKDDARVTFIYQTIENLHEQLHKHGSSLLVIYDKAENAWKQVLTDYHVTSVYTNHDYEPYANKRDEAVIAMLEKNDTGFYSFKDQVIFEKDEVTKDDGLPYTVYTPYMRKWYAKLKPFYLKPYPNSKYFKNLYQTKHLALPSLKDMGFEKSSLKLPDTGYEHVISDYKERRDFPAVEGTSHIGLHLRFGTVSVRELARTAHRHHEKTWLNELIWREFFMMVLYHFPKTCEHAFRPDYDKIKWNNNEEEFEAWCEGRTGYPIVDAGMRELNATGFMHNRVRMIVASFLSKDLLIDWRWGENYFARKLLDYEMSSNVGNWQWAAGCGTDAAPYFRIFNPESQTKKFDPKLEYIKKWIPEYADFSKYPRPIVEHSFARERCLKAFKAALAK
ncbi:cryptochrome/photolyase family protein [Mucilaginibacter myungsuensis]|uniref:Deoxyribodipyrimidine photo-lyase n=1 Tax=Mucilaginibacter myungsuensis TaxID=649104 RepID=A0A929PYH1_9SPHI|nr:deoxyribodipyrimidine photo-lyase [Mucilaginibacter myungsuensis]MBE9664159.1 deoxyribodipyrimidine photo-lyase [Mucilaginibacter myungsuensis]MDN3599862.1 deoxyribodipyrimidine photo-lyase [Mucilaginibacter myungsuensis]